MLLTMTQICIGLAGLGFSVLKMNVRLVTFKWGDVKSLLKESSMFFIGAISGKSFNFIAVLLIGIYCSMEQVASFDISFKILAVMQLPSETLSAALFPTILRSKNKLLNQRIIFSGFLISLLLWGITYWQADFLMFLLGGSELSAYSGLLRQLSILIPVVVLTYLLGPNTLVAFGYQNHFNYSFIIPAIIYIFILAIIWKLGSLTFEIIVISRILVDVLMAVYRLFFAVKFRLIFISR
jgi:PST family polysaccharide transporter